MLKTVDNLDINYIDYGVSDGDALVLLHGWGQNIAMMKPLGDHFKKYNRVVIIDLPGFGETKEPPEIWSMYDYATCIKNFLDSIGVKNPILAGHSFGGKISLIYASRYKVSKLILFGSPFKKEIKKLSLKTKILKNLKKVPVLNKLEGFAKRHIGSRDYKNASDFMRKILVDHVNLDITEDVKKIKCPTIIIWGDLDSEVPIERAYELESLIEDSAVIAYPGCTHYAYLENLGMTVNILKSFIGRE